MKSPNLLSILQCLVLAFCCVTESHEHDARGGGGNNVTRVGLLAMGVYWKGLFRDAEIMAWGKNKDLLLSIRSVPKDPRPLIFVPQSDRSMLPLFRASANCELFVDMATYWQRSHDELLGPSHCPRLKSRSFTQPTIGI